MDNGSMNLDKASIVLVYESINWVSRDYIQREMDPEQVMDVPSNGPLLVQLDEESQIQFSPAKKVTISDESPNDFENLSSITKKVLETVEESVLAAWGLNFHSLVDFSGFLENKENNEKAQELLPTFFPSATKEINEKVKGEVFSFTPAFRYKVEKDTREADHYFVNLNSAEEDTMLKYHLNAHFTNTDYLEQELKDKMESVFNYSKKVIQGITEFKGESNGN